MLSIRIIAAQIETAILMPKYIKMRKQALLLDILMNKTFPKSQIGPYVDHPDFQNNLKIFDQNIQKYQGKNIIDIAFGDSILAMYRDRYQSTTVGFNFAVGGMWSHQMLQMAVAIKPLLDKKGLSPKNIIIGTLGGNELLVHQEINTVINRAGVTLNSLRNMWPLSRLIIHGLPPVTAIYAALHSVEFEKGIYDWVKKDKGVSIFIPMQNGFAGKWGLLPKSEMTAEGIHLSPLGMVILDERLEKSKTATPKSIID